MARNQHRGKRLLWSHAGKVVGWIDQKRYAFKEIRGSVHFLTDPPGIAWDTCCLTNALAWGCMRTKVLDKETGNSYTASIQAFYDHGVKVDRGHGEQLCLPFAFWRMNRPRGAGEQLPLPAVEPATDHTGEPREVDH